MELRRIEIMTGIYAELGMPRKKAREFAELAHAAWIGIQTCEFEGVVNRERSIQLINDIMKMMLKTEVGQKV